MADKIVRKINGMKKTYFVYTKDEADNDNIRYEHWKEVEPGDHGLTDDGYVAVCIGKKIYTDKQKRERAFVKLSCAVGWVSKNTQMLYEPNRDFGLYSQVKPDYWVNREIKSTRFKNAVTAYVEQLLGETGVNWDIIGNIYRPEQKIPAATVRRLFKQQEVREVIDEKIKEILSKKGITQEKVLDLYEKGLVMAETKIDIGNYLKIIDTYADFLEMKPGKKITTESIEFGDSSSIADRIALEEKKLKLSQKTEAPIERKPEETQDS